MRLETKKFLSIGTLLDYDTAVSRCKSQLDRIEQRRIVQQEKDSQHKGQKGAKRPDNRGKQSFKPRNIGAADTKKGKPEVPSQKPQKRKVKIAHGFPTLPTPYTVYNAESG